MMENEKVFTFDVEKISNGFLIFHAGKKVYREYSSHANEYIEATLKTEMNGHLVKSFPQGTTQRLVVTMGVSGKVMG